MVFNFQVKLLFNNGFTVYLMLKTLSKDDSSVFQVILIDLAFVLCLFSDDNVFLRRDVS